MGCWTRNKDVIQGTDVRQGTKRVIGDKDGPK